MHDHVFRIYACRVLIQELPGGAKVYGTYKVRTCECGAVEALIGEAWVPMKEEPCPTSS